MPKTAAKPTIAVDIDDVLAATAEGFTKFSNQRWGTNLQPQDYTEHWALMWGIKNKEWEERRSVVYKSGVMASFDRLIGAEAVLRKLTKNYNLIVITSRGQPISVETVAWVNKHFKNIFSAIHFAGFWDDDRFSQDEINKLTKAKICQKLEVNYLIDDQPKHCLAAAEAGITSLLFGNYAWSDLSHLPANVVKVKDWPAVGSYFEQLR